MFCRSKNKHENRKKNKCLYHKSYENMNLRVLVGVLRNFGFTSSKCKCCVQNRIFYATQNDTAVAATAAMTHFKYVCFVKFSFLASGQYKDKLKHENIAN